MNNQSPKGNRIAKVLSRAGIASRREAEKIILEGRVKVNGEILTSPAFNVLDSDIILIDGDPIAKPDEERLWCFYKPVGAVTTAKDDKNRKTIYDYFPTNLPRLMPVGRLDLNSEGLLLLTNSGELKRKLELPSSELTRLYRVRVKGRPREASLDLLRSGISVEKEFFRPMKVSVDRQQGANAWLTIGLKEGKNREIRRAMSELGLQVNRLIRIEYGPFKLGNLKRGELNEINNKSVKRSLKTANIDMEKANSNKRNQNKYSKVSRKVNEKILKK